MSLKSKVQKSVDIAFEKLRDLAVSVTFDNKRVTSFDFNSGAIVNTAQSYTTYGFLGTARTFDGTIPVTTTTITVRVSVGVDYNKYTEATIDGSTYRCSVISKDQFIVVLSLSEA